MVDQRLQVTDLPGDEVGTAPAQAHAVSHVVPVPGRERAGQRRVRGTGLVRTPPVMCTTALYRGHAEWRRANFRLPGGGRRRTVPVGWGRAERDLQMNSDGKPSRSHTGPRHGSRRPGDLREPLVLELRHLYTQEEHPTFEGVIGKELKNPVPEWAPKVPEAEEGPEPGYVYYGKAANLNTPDPDPGEEYEHTNTQLFNIVDPGNQGKPAHKMHTHNAPEPGRVPTMDGFVTDYISNYQALRHEIPEFEQYRQIMQGHTPDQVPVLSTLARGFAVFDHWFSEAPSQTFPY